MRSSASIRASNGRLADAANSIEAPTQAKVDAVAHDPDPRIAHTSGQVERAVGGAVVDEDELPVFVRLRKDRIGWRARASKRRCGRGGRH